jgi:hypothetical protein
MENHALILYIFSLNLVTNSLALLFVNIGFKLWENRKKKTRVVLMKGLKKEIRAYIGVVMYELLLTDFVIDEVSRGDTVAVIEEYLGALKKLKVVVKKEKNKQIAEHLQIALNNLKTLIQEYTK